MENKYVNMRSKFEKIFEEYVEIANSISVSISKSGKFELISSLYEKDPKEWGCSRGRVINKETGKEIYDVKRNIKHFWHTWIHHNNGNEYLVCGEDYQGYLVINLTQQKVHTYFPEEGYEGGGFCWAGVIPSPDGKKLAVEGCYWACPYELVFFEFNDPDILPLREIKRVQGVEKLIGWKNELEFIAILDPNEDGKRQEIEIPV